MDTLLAYSDSMSYFPGDNVKLYINSPAKFGFAETIKYFLPNQKVNIKTTNISGDLTLKCTLKQSGSTPGIVYTTQNLDCEYIKICWNIQTSNSNFIVQPHIVDLSNNKIYGVDMLKNVVESGNVTSSVDGSGYASHLPDGKRSIISFVTLRLPSNLISSKIKIFLLARKSFQPSDYFILNNFYIFNLVNLKSTDMTIQLYDINKNIITQYTEINCIDQEFISNSFAEGCKWVCTSNFNLPSNLKSGYYFIKINYGYFYYLPIIIKSNVPDSNTVLIIANSNTWNAYNAWGGPQGSFSAYSWTPKDISNSPNPKYKTKDSSVYVSNMLSYLRPNPRLHSEITNYMRQNMDTYLYISHLLYSELYLPRYLANLGINYHVICDMDMHLATMSDIVSYRLYNTIILQVHPEYWSEQMMMNYNLIYSNMKTNLLYMGGNAMYWKVVIDSNTKQMEIRKDGLNHILDSKTGVQPGGLYIKLARKGNYKNKKNMLMIEDMLKIYYEHTYSRVTTKFNFPYIVKNNLSPIFSNIDGLTNGTNICLINNNSDGINLGACGWEVDKCNYPKNYKYIIASSNDGLSDIIYQDDLPIKILSIGSITFTGSIIYDTESYMMLKNFFTLTNLISNS